MSSKAGLLTCLSAVPACCSKTVLQHLQDLRSPRSSPELWPLLRRHSDDLCRERERETQVSNRSEQIPDWPKIRGSVDLTCSLVGLDFLQARQSPQGPALFEGHNGHRCLLICQHQLWCLCPHWQLDGVFYGVHRLCVFFWLGFIWQSLHCFSSLH